MKLTYNKLLNIFFCLNALISVKFINAQSGSVQPPCTNLDFENGFTGWTLSYGNITDGPSNGIAPIYTHQAYGGINYQTFLK